MDLREFSESISRVISEVTESVVTISTIVEHPLVLFGVEPVRGYGSGFVIERGLVATNAHVVRGASSLQVGFHDGYTTRGRILATDPSRDLALVETETPVKPIKLGDSGKLKVGEIVFAVGSPLGLFQHSITMGLVSALGRTIASQDVYFEDMIQTDAAINPGNSGGPLVNVSGEAIGVTTAIIPYAQGLGFAIPINSVKRFVAMVKKYGRPLRAYIGVYVAPLTPTMAGLYRLPVKEGLIVLRVIPGSPAHQAGLREGDIIVEAAGKPVKKSSELKEVIEDNMDKGDIEIIFNRGGKRYVAEVEIVVEEIA